MVLALTSLFILRSAPAQYLGRQQDDLVYIIASHALSHGGYRNFTTPGKPPLTMMTPGFPALLLPVTYIFDEWMPAYQIFCALILAASPWILWLWLRRKLPDDATAALAAALFGTSPLVLSQAGTVMSEGAYAAAAVAFLWAMERSKAKPGGFLLLLLTQLRPAGLSLAPAALARPLWERRWKDAAIIVLPAACAMICWFWWSSRVSSGMEKIVELKLFYAGHSWDRLLLVAQDNLRYYLSSWGSCYLPRRWAEGPAALAAGGALFFLSLIGLGVVLWRNPLDPAPLMLLGAMAMHGVWSWHYERYLIPMLPWLIWSMAVALGERPRVKLCLLLAAQIVFQSHQWLGRTSWSKVELAQTYDWLKSHSSGPDILSSALYVRDGYYAERPSLPLPDSPQPEVFAGWLSRWKVKFVIWQDDLDIGLSLENSSANHQLLDRAGRFLKGDPGRYTLIYENRREKSRIYALARGV